MVHRGVSLLGSVEKIFPLSQVVLRFIVVGGTKRKGCLTEELILATSCQGTIAIKNVYSCISVASAKLLSGPALDPVGGRCGCGVLVEIVCHIHEVREGDLLLESALD